MLTHVRKSVREHALTRYSPPTISTPAAACTVVEAPCCGDRKTNEKKISVKGFASLGNVRLERFVHAEVETC